MSLQVEKERIAIIIASKGRPVELSRWTEHVLKQTLKPVSMIWVVTSDADLPPTGVEINSAVPLMVIKSPIGSTFQRNAGLDALPTDVTFVSFFDDDYVPSTTCIEDMARAFKDWPEVVGLTGRLLADGVKSAGIDYETALMLISDYESKPRISESNFIPRDGLYGCNMAFRASCIGATRFDERLPLYAWQEDIDFSFRISKNGKIGETNAFVGVHQGVKAGRTSGKRFGYSQVANPLYLYKKGTMSFSKMMTIASKNLLANHIRSLRPEPWVDRKGRLIGNWMALIDIVRGRSAPERILEL